MDRRVSGYVRAYSRAAAHSACLPAVRAAEAYGQASRGGPRLDVARVIIGVIEQQKDLVVAVKVAGGEALGADPNAQVAQEDKGLVLPLLQLTNLHSSA